MTAFSNQSFESITRNTNSMRRSSLAPRKSSDVFLPPIHKRFIPTALANLETAKAWSNTTKELISNEWENLEKIKQRGTLAPRYSVLPPISNQTNSLFNNNNLPPDKNHHMRPSRDNEKDGLNTTRLRMIFNSTTDHEDELSQASQKALPKPRRTSKRNRNSRKGEKQKQSKNQQSLKSTTEDGNNLKLPGINEDNRGANDIKQSDPEEAEPVLPTIPDTRLVKGKEIEIIDCKFQEDMLQWIRKKGRRNAICYEIDPLFRELTSIIKYNLLVQHLEEIWMC